MVIYVEYVIIDNMVINSLILLLTKNLLKLSSTKIRIFCSSIVGTIVALLSPILPNIINLLLKIPLGLLMIVICFCPKSPKKLFIQFLTFLVSTFVFGGAVIGIGEIFGIKFWINNGVMYEYKFPVGFALLVCFIIYVAAKNILKYIFQKQNICNFLFDATLKNDKFSTNVKAFLDTGNKLTVDGCPISIINYKTFNKIYPSIELTDILLKKNIPLKNSKYIEVESIGSTKQKILTFEIESLTIKFDAQKTNENIIIINNARLGLSLTDFGKKTDSDIIISNQILGDNYEFKKNKKIF